MGANQVLLSAALAMAFIAPAGAQGLYKCKLDGKVTYQSMPCPKGGEVLDVPPPPTAEQVRAAQSRAQDDRARAEAMVARGREQRDKAAREEAQAQQQAQAQEQAAPRPARADCDALRKRREELYGQRNDNRRNSQLDAMAQTQTDIDRLEADYTKAKCGPLD